MNISHFFTSDYLFGPYLPTFNTSDRIFFYLSVILIVLSIVLLAARIVIKTPPARKLLAKWSQWSMIIGLAALVWTGMRYELINYLSARIVVLVIYLGALVWFVYLLKYTLGQYFEEQKDYAKELMKRKYM